MYNEFISDTCHIPHHNFRNKDEFHKNVTLNMEKIRVQRDMTQTEFARLLEIPVSTYKKMVTGAVSSVDSYIFYKLYSITGQFGFEYANDDLGSLDFIRLLRKLTMSQRRFVESIVRFEIDLQKHSSATEYPVPLFTLTGDMKDGMILDSITTEEIDAGEYASTFGDRIHCAIKVTSNHLHPVYHEEDILLICQEPPRHGDTGIFIHVPSGRAYLRKFYQYSPCLLKPINSYGKTFKVDNNNEEDMSQWIKFGYVLCKMR